jgi:hypothetical protein
VCAGRFCKGTCIARSGQGIPGGGSRNIETVHLLDEVLAVSGRKRKPVSTSIVEDGRRAQHTRRNLEVCPTLPALRSPTWCLFGGCERRKVGRGSDFLERIVGEVLRRLGEESGSQSRSSYDG